MPVGHFTSPAQFRTAAYLVLAGTTAASGCVSSLQNPFEAEATVEVRVEVENQNVQDATVFAVRGAERNRLGMVRGRSNASFDFRWPEGEPVQFELSVLAGGRCVTRPIEDWSGFGIFLQIADPVDSSPDCLTDLHVALAGDGQAEAAPPRGTSAMVAKKLPSGSR